MLDKKVWCVVERDSQVRTGRWYSRKGDAIRLCKKYRHRGNHHDVLEFDLEFSCAAYLGDKIG